MPVIFNVFDNRQTRIKLISRIKNMNIVKRSKTFIKLSNDYYEYLYITSILMRFFILD
jgi:hypothetical protein